MKVKRKLIHGSSKADLFDCFYCGGVFWRSTLNKTKVGGLNPALSKL